MCLYVELCACSVVDETFLQYKNVANGCFVSKEYQSQEFDETNMMMRIILTWRMRDFLILLLGEEPETT